MVSKSYSEKLRDPRWQKKRLEIMQRDEFTCQNCGDNEETLHIHHMEYHGDPWDCPDKFLVTLCEACHTDEEKNRQQAEKKLLSAIRSHRFLHNDLSELTAAFKGLQSFNLTMLEASVIKFTFANKEILDELTGRYLDSLAKSNPVTLE